MNYAYLQEAVSLRETQGAALEVLTEALMRSALRSILAPHIRNRTVRFIDAMGSTTVDIAHRRGGHYIISGYDVWWSTNDNCVQGYTHVGNNKPAFVKEVQALIREYNDIEERVFALEWSEEYA